MYRTRDEREPYTHMLQFCRVGRTRQRDVCMYQDEKASRRGHDEGGGEMRIRRGEIGRRYRVWYGAVGRIEWMLGRKL